MLNSRSLRARPVSSWRQRNDFESEDDVLYDSPNPVERGPIAREDLMDLPLNQENQENQEALSAARSKCSTLQYWQMR
jgi:hypothetical protein